MKIYCDQCQDYKYFFVVPAEKPMDWDEDEPLEFLRCEVICKSCWFPAAIFAVRDEGQYGFKRIG